MNEPWMTKRELARELKCSARKVERLRLPCMRVGGQNRYRLSEVELFLRSPGAEGENVIRLPSRRARGGAAA